MPKRKIDLNRMSDEQLLDMRLCDLRLEIAAKLERRIDQLSGELEERGIEFKPHYWISDDWFSPDGVPGVAIPFYLAHPRLTRLERKMMLEAEGDTQDMCMRILRHEAGHAIDTAYRLRRKRRYRDIFGRASQPYPEYYQPKPYSRSYVVHLDMWYAQSHPVEDFAETFAVWLRPRSRWRTRYRGWPALKKLECVDEMINGIGRRPPPVENRDEVEPLKTIRRTLRQHYKMKREHYGIDHENSYDRDLLRLFSDKPEHSQNPRAGTFLNRLRPELRRSVSRWTGEYQYAIDQILAEMIDRCRELKLRLAGSETDARRDTLIIVTMQIMNYLHQGYHRVAL